MQIKTESQKIKGAVIGVGYLGQFHAQKLYQHPGVDLVGVFDHSITQAEKVAQTYQTVAFKNLEEIRSQVDFVTIAAATQAHYELARYFLNLGIPVLVEKPIAATSQQGYELAHLAEQKNVVFSVGHIERFNPAFEPLIQSAQDTKYVEMNRLAPFRARGADVSVLHDLMIHDLDLVHFIFKSKVKNWMVSGHQFIKETIDDISVRLELENGLQVTINNSRLHPQIVRNYRAVQSERTLFMNTATLEGEILRASDEDPFYKTEKFNTPKVDALALEIGHFVKAVKKEHPVAITGEEASRALQIIENILADLKS